MSVLVTTSAELEAMQPDGDYRLANDIDLSAAPWTPLFSNLAPFIGTLDGDGYQMTGMQIPNSAADYTAFIRQLGFSGGGVGLIKNLRLTDVSVWTVDTIPTYAGVLVAVNYGTIQDCRVTGTVSGGFCTGLLMAANYGTVERCFTEGAASNYNPYLGGLIGVHFSGAVVRHCYSTAQVTGYAQTGGLAGRNVSGKVIRCYSTGSVNGSSYVGGLVGSKTTCRSIWKMP